MLVSFAGIEDAMAMDIAPQPKRIYAVVALSHIADSFKVIDNKVQKVPYQSVRVPVHSPAECI